MNEISANCSDKELFALIFAYIFYNALRVH